MNIRCLKCKSVNSYDIGRGTDQTITCGECGARFFPVHRKEGNQYKGDLQKAGAELADVSRIDLASANSVLLGLMTLHQAQTLQDDLRSGTRTRRRPDGPAKAEMPPPDVSERGGDPMRRARWLAERHEISLSAALRVVRREQSLEAAKCEEKFAKKIQGRKKKPLSPRAATLISALAVLAALGIGSHGWRRWQEHTSPPELEALLAQSQAQAKKVKAEPEEAPVVKERLKVERDETGHVTWISAPTPDAVLVAYCRDMSSSGEHCDAIEIASTRPDRNGARLGLLRVFSDITESYAITILKDRETGWWSAGNGESALMPYVMAPNRIGDRRRPVSEPDSEEEVDDDLI